VVLQAAGNPNPVNLNFPADTPPVYPMQTYVETWILPAAQDLVSHYLNQDLNYNATTVPPGVLQVIVEVAARGLQNIAIAKKGGLITVNSWMQALSDPTIFTPQLQLQVESYRLPRAGSRATSQYKTVGMRRRWGEETYGGGEYGGLEGGIIYYGLE
jgi:hypothetical protein